MPLQSITVQWIRFILADRTNGPVHATVHLFDTCL